MATLSVESADERWGRALRENRVVRVVLSERLLIEFLTCGRSPKSEFLRVPIIKGIPNHARMIRMNADFGSGRLEAILLHPIFDPVPPGCEIKTAAGAYDQMVTIRLTDEQAAELRQEFGEEPPPSSPPQPAIKTLVGTMGSINGCPVVNYSANAAPRKKIPHEFLGPPR
jgi:hypothetical protein